MKIEHIPSKEDIIRTHHNIASYIHKTPVLTSSSMDKIFGCHIYFKCENFQKVGAFKMRGAVSAVLNLSKEEKIHGVATHSSGNHAQALAKTAQSMDLKAYIVMPEDSSPVKINAVKEYGARVILCEPTLEGREHTLQSIVEQTGASFIHPYNDYNIIAGAATAAKELIETIHDLDYILAPIGGGGLMSGTLLSAGYFAPQAKVIGSEPEIVNDAWLSLQKGKIVTNTRIDTMADGLRTNLGPKTFDIIKNHIHTIFTVSESSIVEAMRLVWERMKIIIEPSAAVPLASLMKYKEQFKGKKVAVILSGGNVDLSKLPF